MDDLAFTLGRLDARLFYGDDPTDLLCEIVNRFEAGEDPDDAIRIIEDDLLFGEWEGEQAAVCAWIRACGQKDEKAMRKALKQLERTRTQRS